MRVAEKIVLVGVLLAAVLTPSLASGQTAGLSGGPGLTAYAPKDAVLFVERQGHAAVKKAFAASNLGKVVQDEAISNFVSGSGARIGQLIVRELFSLKNPAVIKAHQKTLHEFLNPFWHRPAAVIVLARKSGPDIYIVCQTGDYQKTCRAAVEKLVSIAAPTQGAAAKRQVFEYVASGITWKGVAQSSAKFQTPRDPAALPGALKGKHVFMYAWRDKTLCVALSLHAADRASAILTKPDPKKSILANKSVARVAAKTHIKDWAFRWHLNLEPMFEATGARPGPDSEPGKIMSALGLGLVRGIGGTGGYVDNVYTRLTYADAPSGGGLFTHGGSYKKALSMTPRGATIALAGRFSTKWIGGILENLLAAPDTDDGKARENPVLTHVGDLLANSDGDASMFLTNLPTIMGLMMGGGGPPIGMVLDVKDQAKAVKSLDALANLAAGADDDKTPKSARTYRKIRIVPLAEPLNAAVAKGCLVITANHGAMASAIDTLLDGSGGFSAKSKAAKLVKLAGDGSAIFQVDMAEISKMFWPMLIAAMHNNAQYGDAADFPLTSIPATAIVARMLGPEIAVFKPDKGGLLIESRGKIPLITKLFPTLPVVGAGLWMFLD
jgi:hypothetical protein